MTCRSRSTATWGTTGIRMELELMGVTLEESGWRSYEDEPVNLSVLVNSENPFRVRVAETVVRYLGYYAASRPRWKRWNMRAI